MSSFAKVDVSFEVKNSEFVRTLSDKRAIRFSPGTNLPDGKREAVSLVGSSTFTALSPPSGAKAVMIFVESNVSLTLKGVTGDGGIAITPSSNVVGVPVVLPLGSSPTLGILNAGSTVVIQVIWL